MDLNQIATFVAVVEAQSFTAAARRLAVPVSTVSRSVSRLEAELGVRLIERTTRALRLTDAGRSYHERVKGAVTELAEASACASEMAQELVGPIRISGPPAGAGSLLAEPVAAFVMQHPRVSVEVTLTSRFVDLVEEGYDLALRAGVLRDSSLMAKQLAAIESWVVAAPRYAESHGTPQTPAELAEHEALVYRTVGGRNTVRLEGPGGVHEVELRGRLQADEILFLRDAAVAGAGVAVLPTTVVRQAVASGRLVRVLTDYAVRRGAAWLVWPSSSHVPARVVALREFLAERLTVAFRDWVEERGATTGTAT